MTHIPDDSFTLSKRPDAFPSDVWGRAVRGNGPWIVLDDGRQLLDHVCALGALTVGHAHPRIVEAVTRQVRDGSIFSMPHKLEQRVAEQLCTVVPCADWVKVVKTGSEATSAAVRIARATTGRDAILGFEGHYHGWHDWWAITAENHPGVPEFMWRGTSDNASRFDALMADKDLTQFAAIILEPERIELERPGYLKILVEKAHAQGILVIFDEMLSGGRLALGGAQEYFGVTPDLATFGKALGGGMPLAFVCGRADLAKHAWPISGTFSGDALALAACGAMLYVYRDEDVVTKLWNNGGIIKNALKSFAAAHPRLGLTVHGYPPRFWLTFDEKIDRRLVMSIVVQRCAKFGHLFHQAVVFANAAMNFQQASSAAAVIVDALTLVDAAIEQHRLPELLKGKPYQDSAR